MSGCRIGRITMKAGGASVRVINRVAKDPGGENWQGKLIQHARMVADMGMPGSELAGFVIIGIFSDGAHSLGFRWDHKRTPIPRQLMPSYVAELIRTDLLHNESTPLSEGE